MKQRASEFIIGLIFGFGLLLCNRPATTVFLPKFQ
jgi:hypothetical protein